MVCQSVRRPLSPTQPTTVIASSSPAVLPNPAYVVWLQQDQALMSMLISSLSEEVMYLVVGRRLSNEVWDSVEATLASSSRASSLNLLG